MGLQFTVQVKQGKERTGDGDDDRGLGGPPHPVGGGAGVGARTAGTAITQLANLAWFLTN